MIIDFVAKVGFIAIPYVVIIFLWLFYWAVLGICFFFFFFFFFFSFFFFFAILIVIKIQIQQSIWNSFEFMLSIILVVASFCSYFGLAQKLFHTLVCLRLLSTFRVLYRFRFVKKKKKEKKRKKKEKEKRKKEK